MSNKYLVHNLTTNEVVECERQIIRDFIYYYANGELLATTATYIEAHKVVDYVEYLADKNTSLIPLLFKEGYNTSQQSHPYSEKDMIDFAKFYNKLNIDYKKKILESLNIWKEKQPIKIYCK